MGTIVVGVDGSESSLAALRWALHEAAAHGHTVKAVQSWEYPASVLLPGPFGGAVPPASEMTEATAAGLDETLSLVEVPDGVTLETVVREGPASVVLLDEATHADHLVLGTRGRSELKGLVLGSVTLHCVSRATYPVTVVPH
jgi:nucleotide-binding universal stress UspA family protein